MAELDPATRAPGEEPHKAPTRHEKVRELFHELHDLDPEQRHRRLEELDVPQQVRSEVEELLTNVDRADALEDSRLGELGRDLILRVPELELGPDLPERIGDYTVLRMLGEGGMGVVYAARRDGEEEDVALKLIRPSLDVDRLAHRFRREVQVLEKLHHPGIATFLDAGEARVATLTGETTLPYLAMELVEGESLSVHAARHRLTDRDRIELLARVCDAVQCAHELGIVHRDLKPGNILVEHREGHLGQPKVLDFGVARATGMDFATLTETGAGVLIGTMPYMSPEQISGEAIEVDPRSDVYSLGVILFELLSGRLPYRLEDKPIPVVARIILEDEPSRLGSVVGRLRGQLEVIVAKALEKDRERRYASAGDLAADLRRYLSGRPIAARPVSRIRRTAHFVRRNRTLVAVLTVVFLGLSYVAVSEHFHRRQTEEESARYQASTYRALLSAASHAILAGDAGLARLELDRAPAELRGWEWRLFEARTDESARRLSMDVEGVLPPAGMQLAFGEDRVLSFVRDRCYVWDLESGEPTGSLELSSHGALDDRGRRFGYVSESGELTVVSIPEGRQLAALQLPAAVLQPDEVHRTRFASGDLWLLGTAEAWYEVDPFAGTIEALPSAARGVGTMVAGPGRRWIITAEGTRVCLSRLTPGGYSGVLDERKLRGSGAAFSPDGRRLACPFVDGRVGQWLLSDGGRPVLQLRLDSHRGTTNAIAYSPDSRWLASVGDDRAVHVTDVETGERVLSLAGHTSAVKGVRFSPDGRRLATFAEGGELLVWELTEPDPRILEVGDYLYAATFVPGGQQFIVGSNRGEVRLYDTRSSLELGRLDLGTGREIGRLSVAPSGNRVAASAAVLGGYWRCIVLDPWTGEELWSTQGDGAGRMSALFSPDGRKLAIRWAEGTTSLWDSDSWEPLAEARTGTPYNHPFITFDPAGDRIAACSGPSVELLDARTLAPLGRFEGHTGVVFSVAFSPDGDWLATSSRDETVRVWNVARGEVVTKLVGHDRPVYGACWSPDGAQLFSAARDSTIKIWNTTSWDEVATLRGHEDYVYTVELSPDGETLLSCGGDGTARIWRPETVTEHREERREYREAAARLMPLVDELAGQPREAATERLRSHPGLDEREREIALQLLLTREVDLSR